MFKSFCNKDNINLEYDYPEDFTRCFWQKQERVLPIWIAYRVILVLCFIAGILAIFSQNDEDNPWYKGFIFYTNWCYIIQCMAFTLALVVTVERFRKEKEDPELPPMEVMPKHYKALWCIYTAAAPSSIVVSVLFWLFLYNPVDFPDLGHTLITHASNFVFMTLDFFLYAIPYRILHFYLAAIYCIIYGFFSMVYQLSGGTGTAGEIPIYSILDWRYPTMALSTCGIQIACLVFGHAALCVMSGLKSRMKKQSEEDAAVTTDTSRTEIKM